MMFMVIWSQELVPRLLRLPGVTYFVPGTSVPGTAFTWKSTVFILSNKLVLPVVDFPFFALASSLSWANLNQRKI